MTWPDASSGEMPGFRLSCRPAPELDESLLDALLTGESLPPDAPDPARMMAEMLASLADAASPGALAGQSAVRAAFACAASPAGASPAARRSKRRRTGWLPAAITTRLAAALVTAAVGLGSAEAAAYAGVLPGPIQDVAHQMIGAPAAHRQQPRQHKYAHQPGAMHPEPQHARAWSCAAYQRAKAHGGPGRPGGDFAKLARAAGGPSKVDGYCAPIQGPGGSAANGEHGRASDADSRGKAKTHAGSKARGRPKHSGRPARPKPNRP